MGYIESETNEYFLIARIIYKVFFLVEDSFVIWVLFML